MLACLLRDNGNHRADARSWIICHGFATLLFGARLGARAHSRTGFDASTPPFACSRPGCDASAHRLPSRRPRPLLRAQGGGSRDEDRRGLGDAPWHPVSQSVATVAVAAPMAVAPDGGGHRNSSQQLVSAGALEHAGKDWKEGRGRHIPFIRCPAVALLSAALAFSFRSCPPLSTFECVDPGHVLRARYL